MDRKTSQYKSATEEMATSDSLVGSLRFSGDYSERIKGSLQQTGHNFYADVRTMNPHFKSYSLYDGLNHQQYFEKQDQYHKVNFLGQYTKSYNMNDSNVSDKYRSNLALLLQNKLNQSNYEHDSFMIRSNSDVNIQVKSRANLKYDRSVKKVPEHKSKIDKGSEIPFDFGQDKRSGELKSRLNSNDMAAANDDTRECKQNDMIAEQTKEGSVYTMFIWQLITVAWNLLCQAKCLKVPSCMLVLTLANVLQNLQQHECVVSHLTRQLLDTLCKPNNETETKLFLMTLISAPLLFLLAVCGLLLNLLAAMGLLLKMTASFIICPRCMKNR